MNIEAVSPETVSTEDYRQIAEQTFINLETGSIILIEPNATYEITPTK